LHGCSPPGGGRSERGDGASYNLAHTGLLPFLVAATGLLGAPPWLLPAGLIRLAHVGMDRALGFDSKYPTGFWDTHLGRV
jgi:hypothetical protein